MDDFSNSSHDSARPQTPEREALQPTAIPDDDFQAFASWYDRTQWAEMQDILWDGAFGADSPAFLSAVALWVWPEAMFKKPWLLELEDKHGGPMWVDDYSLSSMTLDDGEVWVRVERVEEALRDDFGYELVSREPAGRIFDLVRRGGAKLREVEDESGVGEWWFRPDWPRVIGWWRSAVESYEPAFEPDGHVYVLGAQDFYKIGKAKSVHKRLNQLVIQLPWKVEVVHTIPCEGYGAAERELHRRFADRRANGEWFMLTPQDVEWIKGIVRMRDQEIERDGAE